MTEPEFRDKPDWRASHEEMVDTIDEEYRRWRRLRIDREVHTIADDKLKRVPDLTDEEIRDLARREATIAVEKAINEWNERQSLPPKTTPEPEPDPDFTILDGQGRRL